MFPSEGCRRKRLYLISRHYSIICRSQWPRGLRHELPSSTRTLWSWVQTPLKTWMSVCVCFVFVIGSGLATGWSPVQGVLPTVIDWLKWNEGFHRCPMLQVRATYSVTHGAEPFLRSCKLCTNSRTSQHFMELEGSLPCSQEPSTGPCSEPDQSNPYHPTLSL
jgi:hypothetical protein